MKSIYQNDYRKLIEKLVEARHEKGLTQVALAKKLKKPQSFISKYENYERRLDVIEFLHITRYIGVDYKTIIDSI